MMVLFLGGPWHNQRREVSPTRSCAAALLPVQFTVLATTPTQPRPREHVTYTRRYARGGGERLPVYVSPDYRGPARA